MRLDKISSENWQFIRERTEKLSQGVLVWYKGVPFPRREYFNNLNDINFSLRCLNALGEVKKYLFALTHLKGVVAPITLNIKKYETFLYNLGVQFEWTLGEFFIKDNEYSVPVWEIGKFVENFLVNLGLTRVAKQYARLVMMILEFDNAYRYRVQDMFSAVDVRLWGKSEWINKALEIYLQREILRPHEEEFGARGKIIKLRLLKYILWIPKVNKAWRKAAESIDYEKVFFDKNDRFHISYWKGYNFEGKTFEQRFSVVEKIFKTIPFQKREDPKKLANFMLGND